MVHTNLSNSKSLSKQSASQSDMLPKHVTPSLSSFILGNLEFTIDHSGDVNVDADVLIRVILYGGRLSLGQHQPSSAASKTSWIH